MTPFAPADPAPWHKRIRHIQETVADHFQIKGSLLAPNKSQTVARARAVAVALSRELTGCSYLELADAFDRDCGTVVHACQRAKELREIERSIDAAYRKLFQKLSTASEE
jgi:chromosomal replication initiator protein